MTDLMYEIPDAIIDLLEANATINAAVVTYLNDPYPFIALDNYPLVEVVTESETEPPDLQTTGVCIRVLSGFLRVTTHEQGEIAKSGKRGTVAAARANKGLMFDIQNLLKMLANRNLGNPTLESGRVVSWFRLDDTTIYLEPNEDNNWVYQSTVSWRCDVQESKT